MSGPGWTCDTRRHVSCTRSDALATGASYPAITLTVNVAANAPGIGHKRRQRLRRRRNEHANDDAASDPTTIDGASVSRT